MASNMKSKSVPLSYSPFLHLLRIDSFFVTSRKLEVFLLIKKKVLLIPFLKLYYSIIKLMSVFNLSVYACVFRLCMQGMIYHWAIFLVLWFVLLQSNLSICPLTNPFILHYKYLYSVIILETLLIKHLDLSIGLLTRLVDSYFIKAFSLKMICLIGNLCEFEILAGVRGLLLWNTFSMVIEVTSSVVQGNLVWF